MGKIDTTTILLLAAGAAAIYFVTRPKTTPYYPPGSSTPIYLQPGQQLPTGYQQYPQQNPTAGIVSAGGNAAASIINAIWG